MGYDPTALAGVAVVASAPVNTAAAVSPMTSPTAENGKVGFGAPDALEAFVADTETGAAPMTCAASGATVVPGAVGLPGVYLPSQFTFTAVPVPLNSRSNVAPLRMSSTQPDRFKSPTVPVRTVLVGSVLAPLGSITLLDGG